MSMALLIVGAFAAAVAGMPFPVISGRLSANLLSHAVGVGVDVALNGDATNAAQWEEFRNIKHFRKYNIYTLYFINLYVKLISI